MYLVGMGDVLVPDVKTADPQIFGTLSDADTNIVFNNRIANLKKIFPYIPENLNRILMHFSKSATVFYDHILQLLDDLNEFKSGFSNRKSGNGP